MENIYDITKADNIINWYNKNKIVSLSSEDNDIEFFSYLKSYSNEMYDLVLLLNYSGFRANKIFEWSRNGKLVIELDCAKKIINTLKQENHVRYDEIVEKFNLDIMNKEKHNQKTKKLYKVG